MLSLFEILRKVQSRYPNLRKRLEESKAMNRWAQAVGPQIAQHAKAFKVKDSTLWVRVDHPLWRSELQFRKKQILQKLNADLCDSKAEDLAPPIEDLYFIESNESL